MAQDIRIHSAIDKADPYLYDFETPNAREWAQDR